MYPLDKATIDKVCLEIGLRNERELGNATIRQMLGVVAQIEQQTGAEFIHMELGSPGLPASQIGIEAECKALHDGCANKYPLINGIPQVRHWGSEFMRAFLDLSIPEDCIMPTVGSMQACFLLDILLSQLSEEKNTILFLDPCFPVQKQQCRVLGLGIDALDIADHRGAALRDAIEQKLKSGHIAAILYSNPNNPTWMCLTEHELQIIGSLATQYDAIVMEDLAYLDMDFRNSALGVPYQAPYQPSVGHYTDNCVHLVSTSKIFSYAGQRGAIIAVNPNLAKRVYPTLAARYNNDGQLMHTLVYQLMHAMSSGMTHSVQYAMAAMFEAACKGELRFAEQTREYARRAQQVKQILYKHGFSIVYDKDADGKEVGDGFFFTFGYKDWTGEQLINKLIYYGISAITLQSTGAKREGLRGCVSAIKEDQYDELDKRLALFTKDYPN